MSIVDVSPEALTQLKQFELPSDLSFGTVMTPVMIECDYANGTWGTPQLVPYHQITLDPTCKVLHYAQEIFEGMKAYNLNNEGPFLFRPEENYKRFNFSARRMAMPEIPKSHFMDSVREIVSHSAHLIPTGSGDSLYVRPFMFATDNSLGIKPSETFKFLIVASPSQAYFKTGSVKVLVERDAVRACPGGVGNAKTGGNYAASLLSMIEANKLGYDQVLWLDAVTKDKIEEMSGMNFFAVYDDEIVTPPLTPTILNGITRKSIITIADHLGIKVVEKEILIDELLQDIKNKKCKESFACGTAVVITPISSIGNKDGERFTLAQEAGPTTLKLREHLMGIQEGPLDDPFSWRQKVERSSLS